jgi:hypothetical protein
MANETGHVKNVANLKTLITYLESLGAEYNPSEPAVQLPALQQLYTEANGSIASLTNVMPAYSTAVDEQEAAFEGLPKLSTKVSNAYKAVAGEEAAQTVESLKKAINGTKGKSPSGDEAAKLAIDGKEPETRSTSQLSYDNQQQNFEQMVQVVAAHPKYKPNEAELKVASLSTYSALLKTKTQAVDSAYTPVLKARNGRDKVLYLENNGVIDVVKSIKTYLKSVYGPSSPQIKYVNGLQFRDK